MHERHTDEWQGDSVLPVSVIVGHLAQPDHGRRWVVQGVVVGQRFASADIRCLRIRSGPEGELFMWSGFTLRLRPTQADDYALNINSGQPRVYVVSKPGVDDQPQPFLTTVSLDEAQHLDAPELRDVSHRVSPVAMPPEIYRWVEHFVLDHYRPKQRKARGRGKQRSRQLFDAEVGDA